MSSHPDQRADEMVEIEVSDRAYQWITEAIRGGYRDADDVISMLIRFAETPAIAIPIPGAAMNDDYIHEAQVENQQDFADAPTTEIPVTDSPDKVPESREEHLIGWALSLIENADRCLGGGHSTEEGEWLDARDKWRAEFHRWLAAQHEVEVMADPSERTSGMPMLSPPSADPEEALVQIAAAVAYSTGKPVRIHKHRFGYSFSVAIGE